ncbi:hypothetical protein LWI29_033171 [Acer saccharum]|uniref:CCHC-type domain-containing protein n=1 Tax=Acer saccharum TaxID=4024 RepID=A0AA39SYQ4_ACESA|nr:hypothetical protein LWI29_033171 [Acer saccharum]
MIGEVREVDVETGKGDSGRYLRVRVSIEADKPLIRSLRVDILGTGTITTMLLRYERLQDYCFRCGRLGHTLRECLEEEEIRDTKSEGSLRLCVWLRASSPPKRSVYGNGRDDYRKWGRSKISPSNSRSMGNWRANKKDYLAKASDDRTVETGQASGDKKVGGRLGSGVACMKMDNDSNLGRGKDADAVYDGGSIMTETCQVATKLISNEGDGPRTTYGLDTACPMVNTNEKPHMGQFGKAAPNKGKEVGGPNKNNKRPVSGAAKDKITSYQRTRSWKRVEKNNKKQSEVNVVGNVLGKRLCPNSCIIANGLSETKRVCNEGGKSFKDVLLQVDAETKVLGSDDPVSQGTEIKSVGISPPFEGVQGSTKNQEQTGNGTVSIPNQVKGSDVRGTNKGEVCMSEIGSDNANETEISAGRSLPACRKQ